MWERLLAALVAAWQAIQPHIPAVLAFFAGKESERLNEAENSVKAVGKAGEAGGRARRMSRDEQLRWLWERDLLRGLPADDGKPKR